jgi:nucleoside-diphosphate-sugar epimerase
MPVDAKRYLLTGASGYIGAPLVERLIARGAEVVVLGSPPQGVTSPRLSVVPWRLGEEVPEQAFAAATPLSAVFHLAHDWNAREGNDERNRHGTARLLAATRARGVTRFVFASSLSARPDALNRYGRIKAAVEALLRPPAEIACRVGLVYGGPARGMYGTLLRLTKLAPVLPMVDAHQPVQPIHLDEVCSALMGVAERREPGRAVYALGADQPVAFSAFLQLLARKAHGRAPVLLPVPRFIALLLADLSAALPGVPSIDRERVLGLAGISTRPTAADLREIGIAVRPVTEVLGEGEARRQLREGFILLSYCSGAAVGWPSARLYVRCLRRLGEVEPLPVPGLALGCPALLRLYEALAPSRSLLRQRLLLAARVAEASAEPAERFHMLAARPAPLVALGLVRQGLLEACLLCLRAVVRRGRQ